MKAGSDRLIRFMIGGLTLASIVACSSIGTIIPHGPTPTKNPIGAVEQTLTPPPDAASTNASGGLTIKGTYEQHSDTTTSDAGTTIHIKVDMVADFVARSGEGDALSGTAQITYSKDYKIESERCNLSWTTGPLSWAATLSGTYQKKADASILISLLADPKMGPSYSEDYLCLGKNIPESAPFPGVGGTLINGKYDFRQDIPVIGSGVSGTSYFTTHLELAPNP